MGSYGLNIQSHVRLGLDDLLAATGKGLVPRRSASWAFRGMFEILCLRIFANNYDDALFGSRTTTAAIGFGLVSGSSSRFLSATPACTRGAERHMSRFNDDADGRKIFVGGLPFSVDEQAIRQDFGKCGEIEAVYLPKDRETDRPRGFGFVTYKDARDAEDAAKDWNG